MTTRKGLIVAPVPCRIHIRKMLPKHTRTPMLQRFFPHPEMWVGHCTCGKDWQFWFFGATLGYGLEHIRRRACENGE